MLGLGFGLNKWRRLGGGYVGLLDLYPNAEAAYSLRKLRAAYSGAAVRVRESGGNTEADIGFDANGDLDTSALLAHCGANDGFVTVWYDQSLSNDATQTTAANQPKIVSAGALITDNGFDVIQYDGTNDNLTISSLTATGTMLMAGSNGSAFYEVDINGSYSLLADAANTDYPLNETLRIIWDRSLSAGEKTTIEAIVTYTDWSFSGITSFFRFWRDRSELTSFPLLDVSSGTNFVTAWFNCSSLTSFPLLDVSSGTSFVDAWYDCSSLTSFPLLNVSSGTNFSGAWFNCSSLTSFPLLNVSNGTNFNNTWRNCSSLTSFPLLNVSSGTNFVSAWFNCSSLTSFPLLNVSSGTNFNSTWYNCSSLTSFPANFFDTCLATNFTNAFINTALNQTSIDNILVSIDTAGQSNGTFNQSGGSAPSATGESAIDSLRAKGWTITVTGGY